MEAAVPFFLTTTVSVAPLRSNDETGTEAEGTEEGKGDEIAGDVAGALGRSCPVARLVWACDAVL